MITTGILIKGAFLFAILDAGYISLLVWRISSAFFAELKWTLVVVSGIIWFGIWKWVLYLFWDTVYNLVFPVWARAWLPILLGFLMACVTLGNWSLARYCKHHPLLVFLILSGFWGVLTHIWAIFRGILTKPLILRGSSPLSALLIAFFEFIFYWCVITTLSSLYYWIILRFRSN